MLACIPAMIRQSSDNELDENSSFPLPPPGECHACGYDLTGNETGVCPECGARVLDENGRRAYQIHMLRKHRGDRVGLVIFAVIGMLGLFLILRGRGEAQLLGGFLAALGGGMAPVMLVHMIWLRRQ